MSQPSCSKSIRLQKRLWNGQSVWSGWKVFCTTDKCACVCLCTCAQCWEAKQWLKMHHSWALPLGSCHFVNWLPRKASGCHVSPLRLGFWTVSTCSILWHHLPTWEDPHSVGLLRHEEDVRSGGKADGQSSTWCSCGVPIERCLWSDAISPLQSVCCHFSFSGQKLEQQPTMCALQTNRH